LPSLLNHLSAFDRTDLSAFDRTQKSAFENYTTLVGFKLGFRSTFRYQTQMRWGHAAKEWVLGNAFLDDVHGPI
jgi:hypothetical protein